MSVVTYFTNTFEQNAHWAIVKTEIKRMPGM